MLRSRTYRRVRLELLSPAQVCELIPRFYRSYAGGDTELVLRVDDHLAHGTL
jgi:hypothetical protein